MERAYSIQCELNICYFPLLPFPVVKVSQRSRLHTVFITKGIYMLFIVTEILCYIFAILFPPPNKSLPQIASPFPYQLLSKLSLSTEPGGFLFLFPVCLAHFAQGPGVFPPGSLAGQRSWPQAFSLSQPRESAKATLSKEAGMRGQWGCWGWRLKSMCKC